MPHVEDGTIVLLGATTENPSFALNNALLSRCKIIKLEKLGPEALKQILKSALRYLRVSLSQVTKDFSENEISDG